MLLMIERGKRTYQMVVEHGQVQWIESGFVHAIDRCETELLMNDLIVGFVGLGFLLGGTQ